LVPSLFWGEEESFEILGGNLANPFPRVYHGNNIGELAEAG